MALPQQASPGPLRFSALPRKIRDEIYRSFLVLPHPLFLFQDTGSEVVESFAPDRPRQWLALLYTNRQLHDEARAVLYSSNTFYLEDTTRHQHNLLQSFLDRIGSDNAGLLSHICIDFPVMESVGQPAHPELREDDLHSLGLLRELCTRLKNLELLLHGQSSRGLAKAVQEDPWFVREALVRIDAQLKTIPSLSKIVVRCFDRDLAPSVEESMQSFDWVVTHGR